MPATFKPRTRRRSRWTNKPARPRLEFLEARTLLSGESWPGLTNPILENVSNDTLDLAQDLGDLNTLPQGEAVGAISGDGEADVDWYSFTLTNPAHVALRTLTALSGTSLVSQLALYNRDEFNFADFHNPLGHRQLAQDDGAARDGNAAIERSLAPGTYYVAVSGSGNAHFHPFLADSGDEGETGPYGLLITATDLGLDPTQGAVVLTVEPAAGAEVLASPFVLRVNFSEPLDPASIVADTTVQLFFHPEGTFGDGNETLVPLASAALSTVGDELQVQPLIPLGPGFYQLLVAGNTTVHAATATDLDGTPVGQDIIHPDGQDVAFVFQITGREGVAVDPLAVPVADDTVATARDLGDLTSVEFARVGGAIGDDPAYDPNNPDPLLANPAADVDLYRFTITGSGRHALIVDAFAGRIGSPLDPGLTLFRVDPDDGSLQLLVVNDGTLNDATAANGFVPLYTDAVLFAGLTEGAYVLAVSSTGNLPDPLQGMLPGTNGIFDPEVEHSGSNGFSMGSYLLNLRVHADETAPEVVSVTPATDDELTSSPTHLVVEFSEPVNLQQLDYLVNQATSAHELPAVFVRGSDGVDYYPRLVSFDADTNQAVFLMLHALPNGASELHLSGPLGLTDFAGNPLVSNDASGDHVVRFTVNGPERGTAGNPLQWTNQEPNDTVAAAQVLGALFPQELQTGVRIARDFTADPASAPADEADFYQFEVLQNRQYFFRLTGSGLPPGARPLLFTTAGTPIPMLSQAGGALYLVELEAGTYVVRAGGWTPAQAATARYQLQITLAGSGENPTPLTVGPAPAYRIRLVSAAVNTPPPPPPVTPPTPPPVTPPPATPPPPVTNNEPPPAPVGPPAENTPPPASVDPPTENTPPPVTSPVVETPTNPPIVETPINLPVQETPPDTPRLSPPADSTPPPSISEPKSGPIVHTQNTLPSLPAEPPVLQVTISPPITPLSSPPRLELPSAPPAAPSIGESTTVPAPTNTVGATVTIPPDVLAGLRGGPVGGVSGLLSSDTSSPGERLVFRPPQSSPLDSALRLVLLTQPPPEQSGSTHVGSSTGDTTPATLPAQDADVPPSSRPDTPLPPWVREYLRQLQQLWKMAVDDVFRLDPPQEQPRDDAPARSEPREDASGEAASANSAGLSPELAWLGVGIGLALPALTNDKKPAKQHQEKRQPLRV